MNSKDNSGKSKCYRFQLLFRNVTDLLLRFRTHRITLTADIEKAFLMTQMVERDQDVLHFLWVKHSLVEFGSSVKTAI